MIQTLNEQIDDVVAAGNCAGCGGCALLCGGVKMGFSSEGFLRPVAGETIPYDKRFNAVCPGIKVEAPTIRPEETHSEFGGYVAAWSAHAVDAVTRETGSSAGVITALCQWMLKAGRARSAVLATKNPSGGIDSLGVEVNDAAEVQRSAGSRYSPVSTLIALPKSSEGVAYVGKPCEVASLRALQSSGVIGPVACVISFFCAGTPSRHATERLIGHLGGDPRNVDDLDYRGPGWPGKFIVRGGNLVESTCDYETSWGKFLGRQVQERCKICVDGTGEAADISVGDFWYSNASGSPLFEERESRSVVIARTQLGASIVREAVAEGAISVEGIDLEDVAKVQFHQVYRRRSLAARLLVRWLVGRRPPKYVGFHLLRGAVFHPLMFARAFAGALARVRRS